MKNGKIHKSFFIVVAILVFMVSLFIRKNINKQVSNLSAEDLRSLNYEELNDEDMYVENCRNVQFGAYFARDINGDGYADKLLGTCKQVGSPDTLWINVNVSGDGYLKNGEIAINSKNFNYKTNIQKGPQIKENYVSSDTKNIKLNDLSSGNNCAIMGQILSNIKNKESYSEINSITLSGTYVSNEGEETEVTKTIDVTVDWYGTASAAITGDYNSYDVSKYVYGDEEDLDGTDTINFNFKLYEYNKQLTVKSNKLEIEIPELFGYKPSAVSCLDGTYNEENRILTVNKNTTSTSNNYVVSVTYPKKAFSRIYSGYNMAIDIKGKIECYNNPNEEFTNPYVTDETTGKATAIFVKKNEANADYLSYLSIENKAYSENEKCYVVSKQKLLDAYNTQDEVSNMRYTVSWKELKTKKVTLNGTEILLSDNNDSNVYGDSIDGKIINNYVSNVGIYFDENGFLDKTNGTVSIYDNDTNKLIKTFTYDELKQYTARNPYYYDEEIKHIRAETSVASVVSGTYITIYNIKELDTKKIMNDFTEDDVYSMERLTTTLKSVLKDGGSTVRLAESFNMIGRKSGMNISLSKNSMSSTEVLQNEKITIRTLSDGSNFEYTNWKNGIFLVEIPKDIIKVKINDVSINSSDVNLLDWSLYQENGTNYIKIITSNEVPTAFSIVIDCDLTPNPLMGASNLLVGAYGYNEDANIYWNVAQDKYDINGNDNTIENVAFDRKYLGVSIPNSTFITVETVSNYNENGDITIAPNIAEVAKSARSAQINLVIKNNYENVVDELQILGKIPFAGNTYESGTSLNSEFTATMKNSGIKVPEELKDIAKVYYSTKENPSEDLTDANNDWKLKDNIGNFEDIRSYLIVLENYELKIGEAYEFNYEVEIPEGIECNKVSYSCHKVNYYLRVDDGSKLPLSVQPNKVGIRIVRNYNLKVMKYKKGTTLGVQGATYRLREEVDEEEEDNSRSIISDSNGVISLNKLRVNQVYIFEEIKAPNNYELNTEVLKFKLEEQEDNTLKVVILEGAFAGTAQVVKDENGNDVLLASVEDEPKYKLEITKTDSETNEALVGVIFELDGEKYITKTGGKLTIDGLTVGKEYSLKETYSNGYYNSGDIKFTVVKDGDEYKLNSKSSLLKDAVISNSSNEHLIDAKVTIVNEKIPTYNLTIEKVEENKLDNKLKGARFLLKRADLDNSVYYTTDENGIIEISDLYQFVEGKSITGKYTLQEVEEPYGYMLNKEQIVFTVSKNQDGILEMNIENKDKLDTIESINADENNVKLVIQDKPLFKITKTDKETKKALANAEFIIYELDKDSGTIVDYAKDANGDYVGKQNKNGDYTIITDDSGTATAPLRNGVYKMIEVGYPQGYKENSNEEVFEITSGRTANTDDDDIPELKMEDTTTETLEINYIEDLVDLSNAVNSATNSYATTTVKLMRDLDFKDDSSYKNPSDTSYGDLNGDGTTKKIKEELTDEGGCGFTPIGGVLPSGTVPGDIAGLISDNGSTYSTFAGIFDGQKYEIRNLYIKNSNKHAIGLFGIMLNCKVKNLGITGTIKADSDTFNNYIGAICGKIYGYANIENCYSKCDITSEQGTYVGGLIGNLYTFTNKSYIINSYNSGNITGSNEVSGIIGQVGDWANRNVADDSIIYLINCYNSGIISGSSTYIGGIIGKARYVPVYLSDCHNTGNIMSTENSGSEFGGVIGNITSIGKNYTLKRCYNTGDIMSTGKSYYIGGIIGQVYGEGTSINGNINFIECYNNGNISGDCIGGIIGESDKYGGNINVNKCYNTGHITGKGQYNGGIIGYVGSGKINLTECYNIGDIDRNVTDSYAFSGGIIGANNSSAYCVIENCYNEGNITETKYGYLGGIIGETLGLTTINNSYNKGDIESKCSNNDIGGIMGACYNGGSSISNCYNNGSIVFSPASGTSYVGGIVGRVASNNSISFEILKCYNLGDITCEGTSSAYTYISGIAPINTKINMCYNKGNLKYKNITSDEYIYSYIGGIAATNSNITNSYNTGNIDNYIVSSGNCGSYTGGIAADNNNIINSYNTGNIYSYNCSNSTSSYSYVGGISGENSSSNSENNYNIGSVYNNVISPNLSDTPIYTGAIFGKGLIDDNSKNYYLQDIEVVGDYNLGASGYTQVNGKPLSEDYMRSKEFYDVLSQKGDYWKYINNQYPILDITAVSNAQKVTELSVTNTKKTFDITTEIAENEYESRIGGTITGEYNDKYISTNYKKYVETVSYGDSNKKQIEVVPSEGYKISKIAINGERIEYKENENGSVTIPVGYFEKIDKNYHISVTFTQTNNIFTINKVDENGKPLKNAKFKIDQVEDRPEITDQVKDIVGNSNVYTYINRADDATDLLGELTNNGTYYFVKQSDGTYIPNNNGVANSIADSYMKIDLTNKTGSYKVIVNAQASTQSGQDIGLAAITQTTDAINTSTSVGRFLFASGTVASREYISTELEGGNIYYLHFAYSKNASVDTGDDRITINSVNLYGTFDESYDFNTVDGKYVSSNQGKNGTYSMSYIPIDLSQSTGKYTLTVNAEISSQNGSDRGYVLISDNTGKNFSSYTDDGKFIYLTGSVEAKDYKTVLEGGNIYYLHMVYFNNTNDTDNGTDTFTINSVNLSLNTDDFYHEENIITDESGKAIRGLKYGKYEIVETDAPEGYTKDDNIITYIMSNTNDNNITVTNKALKDVVVHYYENETGSEFNKAPVIVSDDVTLYGSVGDWYQSNILTEVVTKDGIQYNLIKDNSEEYVIPDNASGKYEDNQINVYYYYERNVDIGYRIEHYYENKETGEYDLKYTDSKALNEQAIMELKESDYKLEPGYEFEKQEGAPMAVRDNSEDNVIKVYYKIASFDYTVHYFYEGIEDETLKETLSAKYGDKITTYTDKNKPGYVFESVTPVNDKGNVELTITNNADDNVINVYYVKQYQITTDVVEHTEVHKDGKVDENIKGGTISGEDSTPYEEVIPGESNKLPIELIPDEGYQIVRITINDKELDFTDKLTQDGKVVFEEGYFINMSENKHIVVEFRKTATVITRYMDKKTKNSISDEIEDKGYEGKPFETKQKIIGTYQFDSVTDEDGNEVISNGNIPAEGLVVIYWYNKVESGVIERHMEIEKDGSIQQIATETHKGKVGTSINILRKQIDGYEAVDGVESTEENVISMKKDENNISITFEEGKTIEVIYYYSKKNATVTVKYKDNVTGEEIKDSQVINGKVNESYEVTRIDIPGYKLDLDKLPNNEKGTFTEEEIVVEYFYIELRAYDLQVVYKANNELIDGAKIKVQKGAETLVEDYTKNGILYVEELELTNLLTQKYTIFETEIPEYCDTIVSEEKPGNVEIVSTYNQELKKYEFKVKYNEISGFKVEVDEDQKKINICIDTTKIEKYNLSIKKFISAIDDESINDRAPRIDISEDGKITYKLNNRIEEASNDQKVKYTIRMYNESDVTAKGKRIVEYIPDGLVYVPDNELNKEYGWVMYGADDQGQVYKTQNPEEAVIVVTDNLVNKEIKAFNKDKNSDLSYLDVQVIFKVDESKITSDDRMIENKVIIIPNKNDDYPENDESTEKLYVKYFDLNIEKYIDQIKIKNKNGETVKLVGESQSDQLVKVDVKSSEVKNTTIAVTYGLKVKNVGEIPGYATKLIDYIPENSKLVDDGIWKKEGNMVVSSALENEIINPGGSKVVKVTFEWDLSEGTLGTIVNEAKIAEYTNKFNAVDVTDDNNDKQEMLIAVKTGSEIVLFIGTVLGFLAILVTGIIFNKKIVK